MACGSVAEDVLNGASGGAADIGEAGVGVGQDLFGGGSGGATTPSTVPFQIPKGTTGLGKQYLQFLQGFVSGEPEQLALQEQYQPQYTALDLQNINSTLNGANGQPGYLSLYANDVIPAITGAQTTANTATRTADINDLSTLGPAALTAIKGANPGGSALMDSLTKTATDQLNLGTQLDPATLGQINNAVNTNWSNRGLGTSAPAELDQALQLYGGGQNLLAQREGEASTVAGENQSFYTNPVLAMLGQTSNAPNAGQTLTSTGTAVGSSALPTIFPTSDASSLFSTALNQNSAASIAQGNQNAALCGAGASGGAALGAAAIAAFA